MNERSSTGPQALSCGGLTMAVWLTLGSLISFSAVAVAQEPDSTIKKGGDSDHRVVEDCFLPGIRERVECGFVTVPENYANGSGRTIEIHYAVLPAVQDTPKPDPLVILAGGPGQAATELAPMIQRMFQKVRESRDIVLIDQRGTGQSNPLECDIEQVDQLVQRDDEQDLTALAAECLAQYEEEDLTQYHTVNAIRDFERVRAALGYQQVNLYGGSYGTRAGLTYLREAGDSVRTAVLDAVAPTQVVIGPFGEHGAASFELLLEQCAGQERCAEQFPKLADTYQQLLSQLDDEPIMLDSRDPLSHEPLDLLLTSGRFTSVARVALYHPSTRQLLPFVINETAQGNYLPVIGMMGSIHAQAPLYIGLTLSVVCSEDLPRADQTLLERDGNNTFIGSRTADAFLDMCEAWPTHEVDASWSAPVISDKPVLLLSGELDPVTPPAWGELAAETLSNSEHLVAPFGAHTIAGHTCANELIAEFIETADPQGLASECLQQPDKALPFILNVNGKGL